MEILGQILMVVGLIGGLIAGIWLLILAFQSSILWGLGSLFIPFVMLIWVALHWDDGKVPFAISLGFTAMVYVGMSMAGVSLD